MSWYQLLALRCAAGAGVAVVYTIVAVGYLEPGGVSPFGNASLIMSSALLGAVTVALTNGLERLLSVDLNEQIQAKADDLGMM